MRDSVRLLYRLPIAVKYRVKKSWLGPQLFGVSRQYRRERLERAGGGWAASAAGGVSQEDRDRDTSGWSGTGHCTFSRAPVVHLL